MNKLFRFFAGVFPSFVPKASQQKARFDIGAYELLPAELKEDTELARVELEKHPGFTQTDSGHIWRSIPGGHKWLDYFKIYDREFFQLRNQPVKVLEIGVFRGASLKLWSEFFGSNSTIVGIDINEECEKFDAPKAGIHVRIGDQANPAFLHRVVKEFGKFDLIIDDGSHVASHQIAAFNALFSAGLKDDGLYFIEDLEGNYWGHVTGQLDQNTSTVDFLKMLIDMQNHLFRDAVYQNFPRNFPEYKEKITVPRVATLVESIKFYRGVVILQKGKVLAPDVLQI